MREHPSYFRRAIVPTATSLVLHVALLVLVLTITITVTTVARSGGAGEYVATVTLDDPATTEPVDTPDRVLAPAGVHTAFDPPPPSVRRPRSELGRIARPLGSVTIARVQRPEQAPALDEFRSGARAVGRSATFAGMRATSVTDVVYVVDVSGAMVNSLGFVIDELQRSVSRLSIRQRFQVVLFHNTGDALVETIPGRTGLVRASPAERERTALWLDTVYAGGRSNPLDGLRRALEFKPDVVFMLSRSIQRTADARWGRGKDAILAELDRLNPRDPDTGRRPVVIKTIQFLDEDPTGIMQAIGLEHGDPGDPQSHSVLTLDDLVERTRNAMHDDDESPELNRAASALADLATDGADTAVLFGVPFDEQRFRVSRAVAQALSLLARAGASASIAEDRDLRVPFLRARALVLRAALAGPDGRDAPASAAAALLEPMDLDAPVLEAARLVTLGAAEMLRGNTERAHQLFTKVTDLPNDLADIDPFTTAEGWFGLVLSAPDDASLAAALDRLDAARAQPPFTIDGVPDPALTVASADAVTRACARSGDPVLLRRGFAAQLALLDNESLGLDASTRRSLVLEHLAALARPDTPFAGVQPEVAFARAASLTSDPATHAEAVALYDVAGERANRFRADALWEAAALLIESPEPESNYEASKRLAKLARLEPATPRGLEAITAALDLARAYDDHPSVADHYRETLGFALDTFPDLPGRDAWLLECARLLLMHGDTTAALDRLAQINPNTPEGRTASAIYAEAAASALDLLRLEVEDARAHGSVADLPEVHAAGEVARRAVAFAESRGLDDLDRFRADLADAFVDAGDPKALRIFRELVQAGADVPGGEPRLLLGLARAQHAAGNDSAAFAVLRRMLDPMEGAAVPRAEFWHGWALALEILASQNRDGSRTDAIRAHVARLRAAHPDLGGEPWADRIEAVERRPR